MTSTLLAALPLLLVSAAPHEDELAGRIDALVRERMQAPEAVGLSVAVAVGEELILAAGYGLAEVEHDVAADAETMFRIGSVTKQFTSAAIVRLAEQNKLFIDDDMRSVLGDYPTQSHEVTLRHLLTHTSGIPSYTDLGQAFWSDASVEISHAEMLARWVDLPFEFKPGTAYKYSNSGYYLLGMIVEEVTGQSYADYLAAEFFEPLGLERTQYDTNEEVVSNRAQGYRVVAGELQNDAAIAMGRPGAAGGLMASARDLVRWQLALVSGRVVRPESYEEMTTPFMLQDGDETGYGFGLSMGPFEEEAMVSHGGGIPGFNSFLLHLPESQVSVAVISNCEAFGSGPIAGAIAAEALAATRVSQGAPR